MELLLASAQYFLQNQPRFWSAASQHVALSLTALAVSLITCLPLGIWISRHANVAQPIINVFNSIRVVPSLAILFLTLPYLGLGFVPALVALTALACPPILINSYAGLRNVDPVVVDSAYGMGMAPRQVLWRVELPLASVAILAGIRTATVEVISSATLATFIGGGGLGDFITLGFALYDVRIMLVGAVPVALLAVSSEALLAAFQHRLTRSIGQTDSARKE